MDIADYEHLFTEVRSGPASTEVVRQIKAAIVGGVLVTGDQLPPERELASILSVSRVTVRDAFRTLQARGLLEVKVGAKGGTFVTAPEPGHVGESITHMLALTEVTSADVTEARVILELGTIRLACERATPEDLEELDEICDRAERALRDGHHHVGYSVEFHTRLARAGHNAATSLIIETLHEPLLRSMSDAKAVAPEMGPRGAEEHRAIVAAIRAGDVDLASSILTQHLGRTFARLASTVRDTSSALDI